MKKLILTLALTEYGREHCVSAIKAIREATGKGLRESKDVVDALRDTMLASKRVVMFAQDVAHLQLIADVYRCFDVSNVQLLAENDVLDLTA